MIVKKNDVSAAKAAPLPDGGKRELERTGGMREPAEEKGCYELIPPIMLHRLALHYERGANKYANRNWEKGLKDSRCFSSTIRHLYRWLAGDRTEDHLAAAIWNIAALMHYETYQPDEPERDLKMPWQRREWP